MAMLNSQRVCTVFQCSIETGLRLTACETVESVAVMKKNMLIAAPEKLLLVTNHSHMLHVWYIYLHLPEQNHPVM